MTGVGKRGPDKKPRTIRSSLFLTMTGLAPGDYVYMEVEDTAAAVRIMRRVSGKRNRPAGMSQMTFTCETKYTIGAAAGEYGVAVKISRIS